MISRSKWAYDGKLEMQDVDEARRQIEVAEVLRDLCALHHGSAKDSDLTAVHAGQFHGDADAIDR